MASEGKRIIIQQGKTKTEKYAFLMPFSASGFTALLCFGCIFFILFWGAKYDNHKTLLWTCNKINVCYLAFMDKVAHPMFLFIHIWTC